MGAAMSDTANRRDRDPHRALLQKEFGVRLGLSATSSAWPYYRAPRPVPRTVVSVLVPEK